MAATSFQQSASVIPATQVEISISARNLKDLDVFSKSDPMCVFYMKSVGSNTMLEIGRTETIKDCLNPDFVKKFIIDYYFEESQKLKFELYDIDSPSAKLSAHDFLGYAECTLGEIVGAPGCKILRKLRYHNSSISPNSGLKKNKGVITVRAEELSNCKELATIQFSGTKLDKKDFLGKSDPFLVISRANEDGSFTVVHKTEVIKKTLNPTWRPFEIKVRSLCHGNHDRSIKFDCYDWDSDGGHDFIGAFSTTLTEMQQTAKHYDLINPKKKAKKKSYKNSGVINILSIRIEQEHSFLEYIQGGMEIDFTVAVDFTASNGDPRSPNSLHAFSSHQPNQYATALGSVGEIIQDYDTDNMYPAIGFGAKLQDGQVSHLFFLNGDTSNPYCHGIEGVMQAYQRTLQSVQLWGPTNFSPVINHVAKLASACQDGSHYFVLLIITDGVITDMPQTKEAIVKASTLPMSIIIVGVGDAEFDAMVELDGDDKRLSAFGRFAERDIVQFVPLREFLGGRYGNSIEMSKAYLAKEVLAEIPDQVTGYMKKKGIKPRPPRVAPTSGPGIQAGGTPTAGGQPSRPPPPNPTAGVTPTGGAVPTARVPPPTYPGQGYNQATPAGSYGNQEAPPPGYGAQPPPGGYGAQPPPGGYGAQRPPGGYGAQPPPAGYGAQPPPAGYGAQPPPAGYGAQPPPAGYGAQPPPAGYGAQSPPGGYGAQPSPGGYGAQPPGSYGAQPPGGGYNAPPPGGPPGNQQWSQQWGAQQPAGGQQWGSQPQGQASAYTTAGSTAQYTQPPYPSGQQNPPQYRAS